MGAGAHLLRGGEEGRVRERERGECDGFLEETRDDGDSGDETGQGSERVWGRKTEEVRVGREKTDGGRKRGGGMREVTGGRRKRGGGRREVRDGRRRRGEGVEAGESWS